MPETPEETTPAPAAPGGPTRTKDEIALEMMKFVATATGYGRPSGSGTGFSSTLARSPEEQVEALLHLFERCKKVIG